MGSRTRTVGVHVRRPEDGAVVIDGHDRPSRGLDHPEAARLGLGHLGVVGVRLAGGDDLVQERPDRGPVGGRGIADSWRLMDVGHRDRDVSPARRGLVAARTEAPVF